MFNLFGGTIIGPYHKIKKTPNQDRWNFIEENGNIFLAIADGAGSLKKSELGAELAIQTVITFLRLNQDETIPIEQIVSNAIMKSSEILKEQIDVDQLGCTLTVAFIRKNEYCVGVMGDALGIVKEYNNNFELIRPVQESEFANITKLLTSKTFSIETKTGKTENLEFLALGSDGMDLSSLEKGVPVSGFWNKLNQWGKKENFNMTEFLNFLYNKEKVDDDTTLVIAVNTAEPPPYIESLYTKPTIIKPIDTKPIVIEKEDKDINSENNLDIFSSDDPFDIENINIDEFEL